MKIRIRSEDRSLRLFVPTWLIFNRFSARCIDFVARKYAGDAMKNIPAHALERLLTELGQIKKRYGKWELVNIESADGDIVEILL